VVRGGGSGGAGGTGGEATVLLDCSKSWGNDVSSYFVAYANPADFSVNSETGAQDQHSAMIGLTDWAARRTLYITTGSADHRHEIPISATLLDDLQVNRPIAPTTTSPPLDDATGHTHTVTFRSCGVPGD
jgi:hypothetical protein